MEIPSPESPITSLRSFVTHMLTVTCGILIALGLEQLVVMHRNSVLVAHARADFLAEIQANVARVKTEQASDKAAEPELLKLITYAEALLKHPPAKPASPTVEFTRSFTRLPDSAWASALATQSVILLRFPEAQAVSYAYNRQATLKEFGEEARIQWLALAGVDVDDNEADPEVRSTLHQLRTAYAYTHSLQAIEQQLLDAYAKAQHEITASQ